MNELPSYENAAGDLDNLVKSSKKLAYFIRKKISPFINETRWNVGLVNISSNHYFVIVRNIIESIHVSPVFHTVESVR